MQLKFDSRAKYLTPAQQKSFDAFRETEPIPETSYKNTSGEVRVFRGVKYPVGVVTELTVWGPQREDGSRAYHTPLAKIETGNVVVYYDNEAGEHFSCTGDEWLEFIGKGFTSSDAPQAEIPKALKKAREAQKAQLEKNIAVTEAEKIVEKHGKKKEDK